MARKSVDLIREYNRRIGVYKGLRTRWENQGYDFNVEYQRPKKITQGSINRVEDIINELRRQHDVQQTGAQIRMKKNLNEVIYIAAQYVGGGIVGRVGKNDDVPAEISKGDGYHFKVANLTEIQIICNRAENTHRTYEQMLAFNKMYEQERGIIMDFIERIINAVYRKKTASWGGAAHWENFQRCLAALESLLVDLEVVY